MLAVPLKELGIFPISHISERVLAERSVKGPARLWDIVRVRDAISELRRYFWIIQLPSSCEVRN